MKLLYASNGKDQPAWSVDVAEPGAPLKDKADCALVRIRRQPNQPPPEERLCIEEDMLFSGTRIEVNGRRCGPWAPACS